jgi:hypothetical protein
VPLTGELSSFRGEGRKSAWCLWTWRRPVTCARCLPFSSCAQLTGLTAMPTLVPAPAPNRSRDRSTDTAVGQSCCLDITFPSRPDA